MLTFGVSIPYRFNERHLICFLLHAFSWFQFLIGSMKGSKCVQSDFVFVVSIPYRFNESIDEAYHRYHPGQFQFLIGSMKVDDEQIRIASRSFQFLIGSMKGDDPPPPPPPPSSFNSL